MPSGELPDPFSAADAADAARATSLFRAHASGVLLADSVPVPVRFVLDRDASQIVLALDRALLDAAEHVLCLPDDSFDAVLRAALDLTPTPGRDDAATDRFRAYHPAASPGVFARAQVAFAKLATGGVVDGTDLDLTSPLRAHEPRLCRVLNADPAALRGAIRLIAGVDLAAPLAVGVDPEGFDARASAGVVRVAFPAPCHDADQAERVIRVLLGPDTTPPR
jgi:hypothetical protein